ncbi:hypothetical protein C8R43DRAFT_886640, partial [Mycena crocata]
LGFRPQNYKPDHHDYQTYVALRSVFLRSPRGRAALLSGGIIGRLARAVVPDEEVLRGPSDDATINGICLWDGHSQQAYWDDTLTEQEIDLICGVYHISTGWSSWWPRPAAMATSGLNVGWWTPMCEEWYQRRLRQVEGAEPTLVTHGQWKHNLKLERRCSVYLAATERCAAQILEVLRP